MLRRKLIVVHGYGLNKDGTLGANQVVLDKAVKLFETSQYECILLPAGVNEDTGEGLPLICERHRDYLIEQGIPSDSVHISDEFIASDTWTETLIAYTLCRGLGYLIDLEVHAVGFFPHVWKVVGCWRRIQKSYPNFFELDYVNVYVHYTVGCVGSVKDTIRSLAVNLISALVGIYDIKGKLWPARLVKERRCREYTSKNLQHKVIF